jgi:hypothetical protein
MKKILMIALLVFTATYSFAGDDQSLKIKKLLNRKIIFPEQLKITEKTTVQIQLEIMPDGCLALTQSNGNSEIINYIASRIENYKLSYNQDGNNVFIYQFTFEKELSHDQRE